jgi:hypothetical protein
VVDGWRWQTARRILADLYKRVTLAGVVAVAGIGQRFGQIE